MPATDSDEIFFEDRVLRKGGSATFRLCNFETTLRAVVVG